MYVKLFASIYQGTLRGNSHGLLVFTNMLAHADKEGVVDIHPRAIAEEVGLSIDQVRAALEVLESPDDESRSPEEQGRRVLRLDEHRAWGWRVVNYGKYRSIRNEEDRREQNRLAQQTFRGKQSKPTSADGQQGKPIQKQKQKQETDAKAKKKGDTPLKPPAAWTPPEWVPAQPWSDFETMRKAMRGVPFTDAARNGVVRELEKLRSSYDPSMLLQLAVTNGWRTVYPPKVNSPRRDEESTRQANAAANEGARRLLFGEKTNA